MAGKRDALFWVIFALMPVAWGAKLPVRVYTTADGLPGNSVASIIKDSHGYLWFSTREALARYDGYDFTQYTRANGLPRNSVQQFLETRSGEYWAATTGGVARFDPNARQPGVFQSFVPADADTGRVNVMFEDRLGRLWCGTQGGLFLLTPADSRRRSFRFEPVPLILPSGTPAVDRRVISLFEDSRGDLWVGTMGALYRRRPNGCLSEYRLHVGARLWDDELWNQVLEDRNGQFWAATGVGLYRLDRDGNNEYRLAPVLVPRDRMIASTLLEDASGTLWIGTTDGLVECQGGGDACGTAARFYTESNGLTFRDVRALATDSVGNLWLGTDGGGAIRIARRGFITYSGADGVAYAAGPRPVIFRDRSGAAYVMFRNLVSMRRGERFVTMRPEFPKSITDFGWGWHQTVIQDHLGEWWIATGEGLVRFPAVPIEALAHTPPKAVYTTRDGLRTSDIFRLFEDRRGGVWVGAIGPRGLNGLSRWDRATNRFQSFPIHDSTTASAFAEDHEGSVWIGYYDGVLARVRDGKTTVYGPADGLAGGSIQALHIDDAGRLWIASLGGLTRAEAPASTVPKFDRYGVEQGLSSNLILCLDEDAWGRLYIATTHGIDRVSTTGDIAPGRVQHYTQADGLALGEIRDIVFDRDGVLWCATTKGLSLFRPEPEGRSAPRQVLIRGLRLSGNPLPVSEIGQALVPQLIIGPEQNQLQVDFGALAFAPGEVPQYQYRLDPGDRDWSRPSVQRSVNYSNIPPGTYRFRARLAGEGTLEHPAATVEFRVLAPLWQRWWFRLACVCVMTAMLYWLHRYRTMRLLELERVRTRIATDLHDDIGSGLSQIAILTEVTRARAPRYLPELDASLGNICCLSRELAESMNDIVWSVNPQRDHISDLVQRMRRFASDVLTGSNIDFRFQASVPVEGARISTEIRREVYLVFKEAINNLVRHSGSTHAEINFCMTGGKLELRIEDNGSGLGVRCGEDGHGLRSMSERARRIGGAIEFCPGDASGLRVTLRAPLHRSSRRLPEQVVHTGETPAILGAAHVTGSRRSDSARSGD